MVEISLDRLLAAVDQTQFQQKSAEALKNDPPKIIVMTQPAILITIEMPCEIDETAWAGDQPFHGANWATYFNYQVQ